MSMTIRGFSAYANAANVDANQRVVLSDDGRSVQGGSADAGLRGRHVTVRQGEPTQAAENNRVRQQFLDAVLKNFGVEKFDKLPASVRKAFNVGAFKDDMKLDANGRVTSGRPLTARRIREVMVAVKKAEIPKLNKRISGIVTSGQKVASFLGNADGVLDADLESALRSYVSFCEDVEREGHQQKLKEGDPDTFDIRRDITRKTDGFIASLSKAERKAIKTFSVFTGNIRTTAAPGGFSTDVSAIETREAEMLFNIDKRSGMLNLNGSDAYDEDDFVSECWGLRSTLKELGAWIRLYEAQVKG